MTTPVRILVADDSRTARESVIAVLGTLDHAVVTLVENGAQALKEACMGTYALFICDIEMPVMTGSQVLRVLRTQFFSSTELPIIMMTQFGEPEQKVRAFADGANDYVTKPVEPQELLARAKAQIELRRLHRECLANQAITLHAQKLAAVAQLSASVSHELNTPAQYLSDNLAFLTSAFNQLMAAPTNGPHEPGKPADAASFELGYLQQEVPKSLADMREGVHRIATIVQTIREFAEADTDRIVSLDLRKTVDGVVDLLRSRWLGVVDVTTHYGPDVRSMRCCPADLKHALWQLIAHAVDDASSQGDTKKGRVEISVTRDRSHIYMKVHGEVVRRDFMDTTPPTRIDSLRITRAVIQDKHRGELTRDTSQEGWTTAVLKIPA
jgi:two-component system NtrC family sensor kinase